MSLLEELQYFFLNGSITDFLVALVFGQAFSSVIGSLVGDIIIPTISALIYRVDVDNLNFFIRGVDINYGGFLNSTVTMVVSMLVVFFIFIKPFKWIIEKNKEKEKEQVSGAIKSLKNIETMLLYNSQRSRPINI